MPRAGGAQTRLSLWLVRIVFAVALMLSGVSLGLFMIAIPALQADGRGALQRFLVRPAEQVDTSSLVSSPVLPSQLPARENELVSPRHALQRSEALAQSSETHVKPTTLDPIRTNAWKLPTVFNLVENGTRAQGAFIAHVNASFIFSLTRFTPDLGGKPSKFQRIDKCPGMKAMPCNTKQYVDGKCHLCDAQGNCASGTLFLASSMLPGHFNGQKRTDKQMRMQKTLAWSRIGSLEPQRHVFFTIVATCDLDQGSVAPPGDSILLTVDGVSELAFSVTPLPFISPSATPENVLCGRILFGNISVRRAWVEHYLVTTGLDRIVVFDIGMGLDASSIQDYIASGQVIIVDLREEMQRIYGYMLMNVALYSTGFAQAISKIICLLRARHLGVKWTLHFDLDEVLMPGIDHQGTVFSKWSDVEEHVAGDATYLMFSPITINRMRPICNCAHDDWKDDLDADRIKHQTEWERAQPFDPFDCAVHRSDPKQPCKDTAASSKIALRVDGEHYLHPASVGNHHIFYCAKLSPNAGCFARAQPLNVSPRLLYLRHYNCLNLECDFSQPFVQVSNYIPPFWADIHLTTRVGKVSRFPRLQRLKTTDRLRYQISKKNLTMTVEEYSRIKAVGPAVEQGDGGGEKDD